MNFGLFARTLWGAAVVAMLGAGVAHAQTWPSKPIKLIAPFAAGGSTDLLARAVATKLSEALGQPMLVENRTGAGGSLGAEIAAKSPADGYTLMLGTSGTLAINPSLYAKPLYDPARDFVPAALIGTTAFFLLVHPGVPANNLRDFIAMAKAKPGQINYGSAGNGSTGHLVAEYFRRSAGIEIAHVPYKGQAPAMNDLIGGQIQALFEPVGTALTYIKSGKVRALAITGSVRSALAPDVPTVAESGVPNYDATAWFVIAAPMGTPKEVIDRLNSEMSRVMRSADMQARLATLQIDPAPPMPPDQISAFMRAEIVKWGKIVRDSGARVD